MKVKSKKPKMKLQWRRYKTATFLMIIVAVIAIFLISVGTTCILENSSIGYLFIGVGVLLLCAVGYDMYRMYGY